MEIGVARVVGYAPLLDRDESPLVFRRRFTHPTIHPVGWVEALVAIVEPASVFARRNPPLVLCINPALRWPGNGWR